MPADLPAVMNAIAARYAPASVTPPTGYGPIREATADLPNQLGALPAVLVFLTGGSFVAPMGQRRDGNHDVSIRFYYGPGQDLPRETVACTAWAPVLADQLRLMPMITDTWGEVTWARITGYTIGQMTYAGQSYTGIELTAGLFLNEAWSLS